MTLARFIRIMWYKGVDARPEDVSEVRWAGCVRWYMSRERDGEVCQ